MGQLVHFYPKKNGAHKLCSSIEIHWELVTFNFCWNKSSFSWFGTPKTSCHLLWITKLPKRMKHHISKHFGNVFGNLWKSQIKKMEKTRADNSLRSGLADLENLENGIKIFKKRMKLQSRILSIPLYESLPPTRSDSRVSFPRKSKKIRTCKQTVWAYGLRELDITKVSQPWPPETRWNSQTCDFYMRGGLVQGSE